MANFAFECHAWGRREHDLSVVQGLVDRYRDLVLIHPGGYLPSLAAAVNDLGVGLRKAGRRKESLAAATEAVDLYRALVTDDPSHLSLLVGAVGNRAVALFEVGRRAEALIAGQEAVDRSRELVVLNRSTHLTKLVMAINNHAVFLASRAIGTTPRPPLRKPCACCATWSWTTPTRLSTELAAAVTILAKCLGEASRQAEAVDAAWEAVPLSRTLATADDSHLPQLAMALDALSVLLGDANQWGEVRTAAEEAVSLVNR
jgi:tetratricopeptide (TPR) repeat protein